MVLSADHDETAMMRYQATMPAGWLAVPYARPEREAMMTTFKVTSVPRAMLFAADGSLLHENAAQVANLSVASLTYMEMTAARQQASEAQLVS